MRMGRRKTIRNSLISVLVIVVLFLAAGTIYTLLASQDGSTTTKKAPRTSAQSDASPDIKPPKPAANASVGIALNSLTSPVQAGENATMSIQTTAGATCSISVVYNDVPSRDSGLAAKKADDYGVVTWSWTVGKMTPVGQWPIQTNCARNGKSAVFKTIQQVTT